MGINVAAYFTSSQSTNASTTSTNTVSASLAVSDFRLVFITHKDTVTSGVTVTSLVDNVGNTYTQLAGAYVNTGTFVSDVWYSVVTNAGATFITATFSTATGSGAVSAAELTGVKTSAPFDTPFMNTAQGLSNSPTCTSAASAANANEMVLALFGYNGNATPGSQTWSPVTSGGFALVGQATTVGAKGSAFQFGSYLSGLTSETWSATLSVSVHWTETLIALVPAPSGTIASKVGFTQQPTYVAPGASITPSIQVAIQDSSGATVTGSTANVTLSFGANPGSSTLGGTLTLAAVAGVATFPGITVSNAQIGYTLVAASSGLTSATSASFNVVGAANKLAMLQQPSDVNQNVNDTPAITVLIEDASGFQTNSGATVTVAIGTNPGGGTLAGTLSQVAVNGLATFSNLQINNVGTGYTLVFSSSGLTSVTTSTFNINATPTSTRTVLPFGRAALNAYQGQSPDDINQFHGTHQSISIFDNPTPWLSPVTPQWEQDAPFLGFPPTITFVKGTSAVGTPGNATCTPANTIGNLLIAVMAGRDPNGLPYERISDTGGNVWQLAGNFGITNHDTWSVYFTVATVVCGTLTITSGSSTTTTAADILEFNSTIGWSSNPFDYGDVATGLSANMFGVPSTNRIYESWFSGGVYEAGYSNGVLTGTVPTTTLYASEVILGLAGQGNNTAVFSGLPSTYTQRPRVDATVTGESTRLQVGYKITAVAEAPSYSVTSTATSLWMAGVMSFRDGGAGVAAPSNPYTFSFDQPITLTNAIDRVVLPMSIKAGLGADTLVSLYADSAGRPTGLPLAQTFVPKEALTIVAPDAIYSMMAPPQYVASLAQPATFKSTNNGASTSDGTFMVMIGGDGYQTTTAIAQLLDAPNTSNNEKHGVSPWLAGPAFPVPILAQAMVANQGYIYSIGGDTAVGTAIANTYAATLDATGALSIFNDVGQNIPTAAAMIAATVVGNNIYAIGGEDGTGTILGGSIYTTITNPGQIAPWAQMAQSYPLKVSRAAVVAANGWLIVIGGSTGPSAYTSQVFGARINPDNSISGWINFPSIPNSGFGFFGTAVLVDDVIVALNSHDNTPYMLPITPSGPARSWTQAQSITGVLAGGIGCTTLSADGTTVIVAGQGGFNGAALEVHKNSSVSVPLHATGLGTLQPYHVVVNLTTPVDNTNANQMALSSSNPSGSFTYSPLLEKASTGAWFAALPTQYLPLYAYVSGKSARTIHTVSDIVSGIPRAWTTLLFDYLGKPIQYLESVCQAINLLPPNSANFGDSVIGTAAGWPTVTNGASTITSLVGSLYSPLNITNVGQPLFPAYNEQQVQYALTLTSAAAGAMTALSPSSTSGLPVLPGVLYTATAYFAADAIGHERSVKIGIKWYTSGGAGIGSTIFGTIVGEGTFTSPKTAWVQASCTQVAPASAAYAQITLDVLACAAVGEVHYASCISFALTNQYPTTFFDPVMGPGNQAEVRTLSYAADGSLASLT